MAVRKNAKNVLLETPHWYRFNSLSTIIDSLPLRDRARRLRYCKKCGTPILQGEEHLVTFHQAKIAKYWVRTNTCCLCAPNRLDSSERLLKTLLKYVKSQRKRVLKYSSINDLQLKRTLHHQF